MADTLNPEQAHALLDLLTHHETYREIEEFKDPKTIHEYGPPFQNDKKPVTPILQGLVSKFAITLPGLRDVKSAFWQTQVQALVNDLAAAELSESYDKGTLGIRKTLATAISSLIEYPARGLLGSFKKDDAALTDRQYDIKKPDDILLAWEHFLQKLVYSDYFDVLYKRASETQNLAEHDTLTQSAHEYIVVNIASILHYTLILSPEGSTLVRMIENVHKLAPYGLMRQTLRVGNVATMISGMMKLMLAKMSAASFTNWMGITAGADEGMNLLQQIISTVLGWDKKELKKQIDKIEKDKNVPSQEVREALKEWMSSSREEHLQTREQSRQSNMSIVQTILSLSSTSPEMTDAQHALASQYLSLSLAIRDRNEIIRVVCKSNPDNLTQAIRDAVAAYEPMIRQVHQAVDLSETVGDFQAFVDGMLKLCKTSESSTTASVEDFVQLLHKHQDSSHKFLHQVTKNRPEVSEWFRDWCKDMTAHFRRDDDSSKGSYVADDILTAFDKLPKEQQDKAQHEIDAHTAYLAKVHKGSADRIRDVVKNDATHLAAEKDKQPQKGKRSGTTSKPSSRRPSPERPRSSAGAKKTMYGPGSYLAKWQHLLDETAITPDKAFGEVRHGSDMSVKKASAKDVNGEVVEGAGGVDEKEREEIEKGNVPKPPSVAFTIEVLGPKFRELLREHA